MNKKSTTLVFAIVLLAIFILPLNTGAAEYNLKEADAESVQMVQEPLDDIDTAVEEAIDDQVMPGASVFITRNGKVVKHDTYGHALLYKDDEFNKVDNPIDVARDTIFDLASISKIFTVTAAMQLADKGMFELDDPVAKYIPEFASEGKEEVTIRQLMTHTSGFTAWIPIYQMADDREDAIDIVLHHSLENEPGTNYAYSDLNMITLGILVERLSGERQDEYVKNHITDVLEMNDTMYNPPASLKHRIAATEYQPSTNRKVVWGTVHDENAYRFEGIAGHAGVFSTAQDLGVFAQMFLNNGVYNGERILSSESVELMGTNFNQDFPGQNHGLGWELDQSWYMGDLAGKSTMGHTGYTGTSIVISPEEEAVAILLTNRVHPTRDTVSTNGIRKAVANLTKSSIDAWSADTLKTLINSKTTAKEINQEASHALKLHLTVIKHFEEANKLDKVEKHMNGFNTLLDYFYEKEQVTEETYEQIKKTLEYY